MPWWKYDVSEFSAEKDVEPDEDEEQTWYDDHDELEGCVVERREYSMYSVVLTKMIHPAWLRMIVNALANKNKKDAITWMTKETQYQKSDDDHYEITRMEDGNAHFGQ